VTLNDLIRLVDKYYEDGLVSQYWDFGTSCPKDNPDAGDTLALFVAREIKDTFDPEASREAQISEAARVLYRAGNQLSGLADCVEGEL
jgi:hypothetical protein